MPTETSMTERNRAFWDRKLDELHRRRVVANGAGEIAIVEATADLVESPSGEPMPGGIILGEQ